MLLPESIQQIVGEQPGEVNSVGLSGASVVIYPDCVLKIEPDNQDVRSAIQVINWLDGKLPVPKVLANEIANGKNYLLMGKARGVMSCSDLYMSQPAVLSTALAEGLQMLWHVDPTGCPKTRSNKQLLLEARQRVETDAIEYDLLDPNTFGPSGFQDPEHLLIWLEEHCPEEDWSLCHGDLCLPNVFLENGHVSCFIDLGDTAIGDKWRDIALCYRSLDWNYKGLYGGKVYKYSDPMLLFDKLGFSPDWDKIRYHILLDELF